MKSFLRIIACFALGGAALSGSAQAAPASRTGAEILLRRETGKGFVLVDRATGVLRIGTVDGAGALVWEHTVDTGLPDVSDVSGGVAGKSGELMAVASPMSNRLALVEIDAAYPSQTRLFPRYVGPRALSEIDSSGGLGLLVGCSLSGEGLDDILEIWKDFNTTPAYVRKATGLGPIPVLEPFHRVSDGATFSIFARETGGDTQMGYCMDDATILYSAFTLPGIRWQFITNVRSDAGEDYIVFYRSGETTGYFVKSNTTSFPTLSMTLVGPVTFPFEIGSLSPVAPDADMPGGMLAASKDRTRFAWWRIDGGGTVSNEQEFNDHAAGGFLAGLNVPGKGLVRFEAVGKSKTSQVASVFRHGSSGWKFASQGDVPQPEAALDRQATLFYFDSEPFIDEEARLLDIEPLPDWTRKIDPAVPAPAMVYKETYAGGAQGLGSPVGATAHFPSGTGYVLTNQVSEGLSLAAVQSGVGLLDLQLAIDPPSGSYASSVTVVPSYDESRHSLWLRNAGPTGDWHPWPGFLVVASSDSYLFILVDSGGVSLQTSRILRRDYQIDPAGMNSTDSDHDGVPDYVEQALGLNPLAGADSDADGVSDLEEILAGSLANDDGSLPATRNPVPVGDGVELVGLPFSVGSDEALDGEEVTAYGMAGTFVGRAPVGAIPASELPGIVRGAWISSTVAIPQNELLEVSSGSFFQTDKTGTPVDEGIEIRRFIPVPLPPDPAIAFTPSGTDLAADAAGWIAAARVAYATYAPVSERTDLVPDDTAGAVFVEAMLHAAATDRSLIDPPVALGDFTAFPSRVQDAARTPVDRALVGALAAEGMDFGTLLELAQAGVNGAGSGSVAIRSAVGGIYDWHLAHFGADRSLALPLDVLRTIFSGGTMPENYDGAVSADDLAAAQAAAGEIVASWSSAMRPTGSWLVEIQESSPGTGVYPRRPDAQLVELFDAHGEIFQLEQDRSLTPGSQFTVTGFTDVVTASGNPGMEVLAVTASLLPASSSRDLDANLLDDEWERFFFGATGQDPQSVPAGSAYSLLQHFLEGTDPRSNGADDPGVPVTTIAMGRVDIQAAASGFDLGFTFPASYLSRFAFVVEASETMASGSFHEVPGTAASQDPDYPSRARITVQANPATAPKRFYRVRLALP